MTLTSKTNNNDQEQSNLPSMDVMIVELLASRICHDLISPVGAIHNGVEFMEEMGIVDKGDEALGLISDSAGTALGRLKAFRMAYGAGGSDTSIKLEDVYNIFAGYLETEGKVSQEWDPHAPTGIDDNPVGYCKTLMSTLLLTHEALYKGGTITVEPGQGQQTLIIATGPTVNIYPDIDKALQPDINADELTPRLVHPYILAFLARHYGFNMAIEEEVAGRAVYSITSA